MNIVFRINYHTVPGQSLWLKYSTVLDDKGVRFDQVVPLRWRNDRQWETTVKVSGAGKFRIEYHYQVRQDNNGVEIDEWQPQKVAWIDLDNEDAAVLIDSWCAAGIPDHAYETKGILTARRADLKFTVAPRPEDADHTFCLRMSALPPGKVPCVLGNAAALGNWGWFSAVPLTEVAENMWQVHRQLPADADLEYKYGIFDTALKCVVSIELGENRVLSRHDIAPRQHTYIHDELYRRSTAALFHGAGVSLPVFSLRSEKSLGIGEFADLKPFADWANGAALKLIQILPINDTTSSHNWDDSYPYSAISVFALHPIFLRIEDMGYAMPDPFQQELNAARAELNPRPEVDHPAVAKIKTELTRRIFEEHRDAILASERFKDFLAENSGWVIDYAVFCVKRDQYGSADFSKWHDWAVFDAGRVRAMADPKADTWPAVAYHIWLQLELDAQLTDAIAHLHERGIVLKGDLPIGIDRQSVEAWSAPHLFKMDAQAGAPPDPFAVKGQNWGFPTYDWDVMKLDDYAWWQARFSKLSRYFDVYRIDHILGFFRIWQIPTDHVEGIMGHFDPALPIHLDDIINSGIPFEYNRYCRPYIHADAVRDRFGDAAEYVLQNFLQESEEDHFELLPKFRTQRRIEDWFRDHPHDPFIREGLMDCASEVLFHEVTGSDGKLFHPRISMQSTHSYQDLDPEVRQRMEDLYNQYFYQTQEDFWQARGYEKLPAMRRASDMLLCGEDLGMVPACVPGVLRELGILSLEIQRMPKTRGLDFSNPLHAPYMSVVSPSTHDMAGIREWWAENPQIIARFAWQAFGMDHPQRELSGEIAGRIIQQHLSSPAMWAIFPLQDLLAMDEEIRHPNPSAERINVPAMNPFRWRYRMHLGIEQLRAADGFNRNLRSMVESSAR